MSQTINPFKKIPPQFIIKDATDILYKLGLSSHRKLKRESKLHKSLRYILVLFHAIISLKSFLLLILYKIWSDNQIESSRIFVYFGDFTYNFPQIRIHWNAAAVQPYLISLVLHLWHIKQDNMKLKWLNLLDCLSGKIEPYKIGLYNVEDIEKIVKR